jgi:outer membrane murein-binding lipoprotein Lpp
MENPWVIRTSYCSEEEGFPHLLRSCALRLGIRKKPEYVWKEYRENGMEKCSMAVYLGESRNYPNHPPFQITFIGHRFPDTCQSVARKALKQLCQNYNREIFETPLRYFPPSNKNTPTWKKRLQALSGGDPIEDDPTIVYMAGYLHTVDNHYDELSSHCTHLNSRVESLEQQVKELTQEKASLQESLSIVEGEEANTREAYRTLKIDFDKKLKALAPKKKIQKKTTHQGCQTEKKKKKAPLALPPPRIDDWSDEEDVSLASLDDLLKAFGDTLDKELASTSKNALM